MAAGMKVCLVRHGETAWSLSGRHTGVTDLGLTAHGEEESRSLAPRLRILTFARVLVSPRLRARQTCELAGVAPAPRKVCTSHSECSLKASTSFWNRRSSKWKFSSEPTFNGCWLKCSDKAPAAACRACMKASGTVTSTS